MYGLVPPAEELEFETLRHNGHILGLEYARVSGLDAGAIIFEIETQVTNLVSANNAIGAYDYLAMMAMRIAHRQGLGDPEVSM